MFSRLRKLMGQPEEEHFREQTGKKAGGTDAVTIEKTEERPDDSLREIPEPVKELLPLINRITDLINSSVPDFLQPFIDKEAETREIYNRLSEPLAQYTELLSEKVNAEHKAKTAESLESLTRQVATLTARLRETDRQKEEIQNLQLSSERQKRAYTDHINELEAQTNTIEAQREDWEKEKKELKESLKNAEEKIKDWQKESAETEKEKTAWELKQKELNDTLSEYSIRENEWKKNAEASAEEISRLKEQIAAFAGKEEELKISLQKTLDENKEKELQQEELGKRIAGLQTQLNTIQEEEKNKKAETELRVHQLTEQINNLQSLLSGAELDRQKLQQQLESAGKETEINRKLAEENRILHQECDNLKRQIEINSTEHENVRSQLTKSTEEAGSFKEKAEKSEAGLHEALQREQEWLKEKEKLETDKLELEKLRNEETKQLAALRRQIEELSTDRESQIRQWRETEAAVEAASKREKAIQHSLKTLKEEHTILLNQVDEAKNQRLEAEKIIEELTRELEKERQKQTETGELKSAFEKLKEEKETIGKALEQAQATCAELMNKTAEQNNRLQQVLQEKSKEESGSEEEIKRLKHELLVVTDMLTALKNQRQNLLQTVEKESAEKKNLRQYVTGLENTLKQNEETLNDYRRRIGELERAKQVHEGRSAGKNKTDAIPSAGVADTEENWLVHPLPDTPEMIEKKKAAKKTAEQPEPEPEKIEIKPDPSQMSLW